MIAHRLALRPLAAVITIALIGIVASFLLAVQSQLASAQMTEPGPAKITDGNQTSNPDGFREWVFLGAPLTPNGLNDGAAGFPEFHHVYIEPGDTGSADIRGRRAVGVRTGPRQLKGLSP